MANIFPKWTNRLPVVILLGLFFGGGFVTFAITYWFSPKFTDVGYAPKQPIPFSHKFHAGKLGLDCRYCHYTVEKSSFAAIPPTQVCMGCHTNVLKKSDKLAKVRQSYKTGKPIEWVKVHMLPDYAFFNHKAHISAGVGCASCHGRIDKMKVVAQSKPLSMSWCLDCHRSPNKHLRPKEQVTNMEWDNLKKKGLVRYVAKKDQRRRQRKDVKAWVKAVKEGRAIPRQSKDALIYYLVGNKDKLSKVDMNHVVVTPPEHCSGCHR